MLLIGDVHGKIANYKEILDSCESSIQLGDLGFDYSFFTDQYKDHFFIGGNHDNWDILTYNPPSNYIGRYGTVKVDGQDITFCSGGYSIDRIYRVSQFYKTGQKSFWENEELSWKEGVDFLSHYAKIKPEIMISHSCPSEISNLVGNPKVLELFNLPADFCSSTQELLQQAFDIHRPSLWVFGHMHRNWYSTVKGTEFYCLNELETFEL